MDNLFFDRSQLKYCGQRVIIGHTVRIRYPHLVELHDDVIIDDFTFISTGLIMENHSTIMPNCSLTGGQWNSIHLKKYSCVSSTCSLLTSSHDFRQSLHLIHRNDFDQNFFRADITFGEHAIIGCNTTVLPGSILATGTRVGAQSLVSGTLEPWILYAGSPAKKIGTVNRDHILQRLEDFENSHRL